jgi:hypothetical protein
VHFRTGRWIVVLAATGLFLSGCGTDARHVTGTPASPVPTAVVTTAPPYAPPSALNSQTLSQIDAQLVPVASGLAQANSDINNPQPDS